VKRSTFSSLVWLALVLTLAIAGCGGSSSSSVKENQSPVTVSVALDPSTVPAGGSAQVTATVSNDSASKGVTWTVSCSAAPCGSVSPTATASGVAATYTAPASALTSNLLVKITATAVAAGSTAASATVTVTPPPIAVSVTPTPTTVPVGTRAQFTATVTNDPANKGVSWNVDCASPPCGTISPAATPSGTPATYTAPTALPTGDLNVVVTATSLADTSAASGVSFLVPGTSVSIDSQSTGDVQASGTSHIVASVANDPTNNGVTWTLSCDPGPCGTISPAATLNGVATTYTAPSTPPADDLAVTITATSVFNTGASNFAQVIVHAITVSVTPTSALMPVSATQQFTATDTYDPANAGVTWALSQDPVACSTACGTISPPSTASGSASTYTAPAAVPADHTVALHAVSVKDSTKSATATLTITAGTVKLVPASLNLGVATIGGTSRAMVTMLTNTGSGGLNLISITTSPPFAQANDCGASVGSGMSCTISITFKPTKTGTTTGNLTITDDSADSPQQVSLSGYGFQPCRVQIKQTLSGPLVRSALATFGTATAPSPTGTNRVGTRVMRLVDPTRDDPFLENGTKRELMVRFWYPTSPVTACTPAEYMPPAVWSYFSQLTRLPLPAVTTNSCLNAPITNGAHPVVVFTHGYTGTFTDYTFIFEDLASRGYVVASVDHTYEATAVEFPDGRFVHSGFGSHLGSRLLEDETALSLALTVRLADLKFVRNELERMNTTAHGPFAGKLDTTKVALAGHSMGGLAASLGVQRDRRFRAGVILDVHDGKVPDAVVRATATPVLILASGRKQWTENECKLWSSLRGSRFAVNLEGAEHLTTSDAVWLFKDAIKTGAMGPEKAVSAVRDYIAAFLDANLQGKSLQPLLAGPSSDYPDATVTTQMQSLCGEKERKR
jgi:dienelactone hydrolase